MFECAKKLSIYIIFSTLNIILQFSEIMSNLILVGFQDRKLRKKNSDQ